MALTTAQRVRLKIQDVPIRENLTLYGDGTAVVFHTQHANITNAGAYVPGGGASAWSATGCSFDVSGWCTFSNVISANSAFNVRYDHTTFSDDEIDQFLTDGGSVLGAAQEAVEALLFDAVKRARWMASDGSSYDDTNAQTHLREMHALLKDEIAASSTENGGFGSWALNQGDW